MFKASNIPNVDQLAVNKPLPEEIAEHILLNQSCHVDHEGFDLNEIEQQYYKYNNIALYQDKTWYKDGGQEKGANGVLHSWIEEFKPLQNIIIDHSHFVFRYPITGEAANQVKKYSQQRPELLRVLSSAFKCGLDFCIDYLSTDRVEPIVHIEWDYDNIVDMLKDKDYVESTIREVEWDQIVKIILKYNKLSRINKITAFEQADFRSMLVFGKKSYYLIPTL